MPLTMRLEYFEAVDREQYLRATAASPVAAMTKHSASVRVNFLNVVLDTTNNVIQATLGSYGRYATE